MLISQVTDGHWAGEGLEANSLTDIKGEAGGDGVDWTHFGDGDAR
ncbi:MAG: hypothetical protein AAGE59_04170 [Cyanobacteria bacterium P01_F01_bin.86]